MYNWFVCVCCRPQATRGEEERSRSLHLAAQRTSINSLRHEHLDLLSIILRSLDAKRLALRRAQSPLLRRRKEEDHHDLWTACNAAEHCLNITRRGNCQRTPSKRLLFNARVSSSTDERCEGLCCPRLQPTSADVFVWSSVGDVDCQGEERKKRRPRVREEKTRCRRRDRLK